MARNFRPIALVPSLAKRGGGDLFVPRTNLRFVSVRKLFFFFGVRQNTIGGGGVKKRHVEMSFAVMWKGTLFPREETIFPSNEEVRALSLWFRILLGFAPASHIHIESEF